MSNPAIGRRVGVIRNTDQDTVYLFGYGTYQGSPIPPDDVLEALWGISREALVKELAEVLAHEPTPEELDWYFGNPKLVLDDGRVLWGCQSYWGDEDRVREAIGSRQVVLVDPEPIGAGAEVS